MQKISLKSFLLNKGVDEEEKVYFGTGTAETGGHCPTRNSAKLYLAHVNKFLSPQC